MIKDRLGEELKVGDTVLRAKFSELHFHVISKITEKGFYISRFIDKNIYGYIPRLNDDFNYHNGLLYMQDSHGLIKVNIKNDLDITKLKTLQELNKNLKDE